MVMEEENKRILQYAKEQEERERERMAMEKKSEEAKTLVYQKVRKLKWYTRNKNIMKIITHYIKVAD